jgi:FkbM family methyltransferase
VFLKIYLAKVFPRLRVAKQYWNAVVDHYSSLHSSYSQGGEDRMVADALGPALTSDKIYIEVGGNHPTKLSNSYRFYRMGLHGIIIEPNIFFKSLFHRFRPRDEFIPIGCGKHPELLCFTHHENSVLSGFSESSDLGTHRSEYLPVFPLDNVIPILGGKHVFMLSIDVEGMDYEVLEGGKQFIAKHVETVVIEYGCRLADITSLLGDLGFELYGQTIHNAIFKRRAKLSRD